MSNALNLLSRLSSVVEEMGNVSDDENHMRDRLNETLMIIREEIYLAETEEDKKLAMFVLTELIEKFEERFPEICKKKN
jgi:hypothetical protein